MKILLLILLFIISANAGLPPTTSKISGDTTNKTTFNYQFPNFTGTHTGTTVSLGVNGIAGGGTGSSTKNFVDLTTNQTAAGSKTFSSAVTSDDYLFSDAAYNTLSVKKELSHGMGTGVNDGAVLTIADATHFDISASAIQFSDYSVSMDSPVVKNVSCGAFSNVLDTNLASGSTYVSITPACAISQQTTFPTQIQRRTNAFVGRLAHSSSTIVNAIPLAELTVDTNSQMYDLFDALGAFNISGNVVSPNGANLSFNKSSGTLFRRASNRYNTNQNPHVSTLIATAPTTIVRGTQTTLASPFTTIDPTMWDNAGTATLVSAAPAPNGVGASTNQRVYAFANGTILVQYGQAKYSNLSAAIAAISTESFVLHPNVVDGGTLIAIISCRRDATDLSNTAQCNITRTGRFDNSGVSTGSLTTTNLQQAYDNSVTPQILTSTLLGSFDIKRGSAADTDYVMKVLNGAGSLTWGVTGDGVVTASSFTNNLSAFAATTSLQLAGVISDETGSGSLVFGTSPTLVTPALGTPSALVATNATGTASGLTSGKATNIVGGLGGSVPYQSAVDTTVLLANGSSGQVLTSAGGTSAPSWATPAIKNSFNAVENLSFATSVGSNALTIAAKDSAGSNPSSTTTAISFRSSTLTSGAYVSRTITSALSIVISSGSTLGHTSAVAKNIWLYAIDNAGTVELAVSSNIFDESYLYSTTAEGGAGAADSESVLYSTTARSNVAIRLIGRLLSTQTTAGTWAAVPTDVSMHGFKPVSVYASYRTAAGQSIANASMPIIDFGGVIYDPYNAVTTGASWKFTAPIAGLYLVENCLRWANSLSWTAGSYIGTNIYKNGSLFVANDTAIQTTATFATGPTVCISEEVRLLPTEYIDVRASHGESAARALLASSGYNRITVLRVGEY